MDDIIQRAIIIVLLMLNLFAAALHLKMLDKILDHMEIVAPRADFEHIKEEIDPNINKQDKWVK